MGRKPTYHITELPEGWQQLILDRCNEGWSAKEIMAELHVTAGAHGRFMKDHEDYREAFELGRIYSEAWWTRTGRENLGNSRGFNTGIWAFNLKNHFGWRDVPLAPQAPGRILNDKVKEAEELEAFRLKKEGKENGKGSEVLN